jgi:hypothetical protein
MRSCYPDVDPTFHYSLKGRNHVITIPKATMSDLVDAVANGPLEGPQSTRPNLPVLTTSADLHSEHQGQSRKRADLNDLNVFQAVEEQLGLKLEARKESVELPVVDRAERPSAN